jgi:hypothetical protein
MTFYELMALFRVRNSHHFVNWACVSMAVIYGQSSLDVSSRVPTFFGFSASLTTLATKTAELGKLIKLYEKVTQELKSEIVCWCDQNEVNHTRLVFIACYDNSQKNTKYKFQQDDKTSNFVKVTAWMFLKILRYS